VAEQSKASFPERQSSWEAATFSNVEPHHCWSTSHFEPSEKQLNEAFAARMLALFEQEQRRRLRIACELSALLQENAVAMKSELQQREADRRAQAAAATADKLRTLEDLWRHAQMTFRDSLACLKDENSALRVELQRNLRPPTGPQGHPTSGTRSSSASLLGKSAHAAHRSAAQSQNRRPSQ
jgi:hypothetical protein